MPKGQKLISHVKITNTSSGKVVMLDGAEADSVITQIDSLTSENRNKAYIRYEDPATKNKIVLELCCVEVERLPSTVEEFDARECELDCCEQQFFGTFKTSVNQQTGEFPKKSQPSVPDKPKDETTPDKPKEDTPTKPSENGGSDSGNTTPTNPSDNNGNTGTTEPTTPSDNGNTGNTTPTNPSDNGNTGNTDNSTTQPSEQPTVLNQLTFEDAGDNNATLFDLTVRGKVGETVVLGDVIQKEYGDDINGGRFNSDGNYEKDGIIYTIGNTPSIGTYYLKAYEYVIKENGHSEEIPLQRNAPAEH